MINLQNSGAAARQSRLSWQSIERNFSILLLVSLLFPILCLTRVTEAVPQEASAFADNGEFWRVPMHRESQFFSFMADQKYLSYLKSPEWASMKLDLIQIRGQKCERCGTERAFRYLQMHHLTYKRIYKELPEDLELLCAKCHMKEHNIKPKKKQKKAKVKKRNNYKEKKKALARKHGGKNHKYYQELQEINRIEQTEKRLEKRRLIKA